MEGFRAFMVAVAARSLAVGAVGAAALALAHQYLPALAAIVGVLIGLAYLFHIATSFNRLAKGGKGYVPFVAFEGLLRILVVGIVPFIILPHGPWLGYFTYLAGFVAALAAATTVYKNRIHADCGQTDAVDTTAANPSA